MIAQRLAERLIRLACRSLPEPDRAGRYREWTAETAAILDDPGTRSRARRGVRALLFAADHIRGARRLNRRGRLPRTEWGSYAQMAFPLCVLGVATLSTRWLPVVHSVRLTVYELVLGAGMIYQIARERRYWRTAGKVNSIAPAENDSSSSACGG
jgi:hypothetical protein